MKTRMWVGLLFAGLVGGGIAFAGPAPAAANSAKPPNTIATSGGCKRHLSGGDKDACIACVKRGKHYHPRTGQCGN